MSNLSTVRPFIQADGSEVCPVRGLDFNPAQDDDIQAMQSILRPGLAIGCRLYLCHGNRSRLLWLRGQHDGEFRTIPTSHGEDLAPVFDLALMTDGWHQIPLGRTAVSQLYPGEKPLTDPEEFDIDEGAEHLPYGLHYGPYPYVLRRVQPESTYYVAPTAI